MPDEQNQPADFPIPPNEQQRLAALRDYHVLDTPPEAAFDRLTRLAARLFDVPIALVNLVDGERQWFKSSYGLDIHGTSRHVALCAYAILAQKPMIVRDAREDPRFGDNPLVVGPPSIRFYAGVPLQTPDGYNIGTFTIIDTEPRDLSDAERATLVDLAAMAVDELELRRVVSRMRAENDERQRAEQAAAERARLNALSAEISAALTQGDTLQDMLQSCAAALVRHLDAAFARIWTLNEAEQMLELQASAGLYTHLGGPHGRVPVGAFKIGAIARDREAHLTNSVVDDPGVTDREWARREGMVAFAGYPLVVEERAVGVMALFARQSLTPITLDAMASVANEIALGVERKRAEESLRHKHDELTDFFEQAVMGLHWVGEDGTILWANQAELDLLGYTREEYIGHSIVDFHADPPAIDDILRRLMNKETLDSYEARLRCKDGSIKHVLISSNVLWQDGKFVHTRCFTRDITPRKQAEDALREREEMLRVLVEASPDVISIIRPDNTLSWISASVQDVLGYRPEDLEQRDVFELMHPDDRDLVAQVFDAGLAERKPVEAVYRFRHRDGHWVVLETHGRWMTGADDEPTSTVAVTRDVTERVRLEADLRRARQEAEQANRAKTEFLSRMSHELRTPLHAILGFGQLLEVANLDAEHDESVDQILKGGQHLLRLINEVLEITRVESGRVELSPEPVPVYEMLDEVADLVAPLAARRQIHVEVTAGACEWHVRADNQRLKQVLLNLVSNAIKYNHEGGTVTLACSETTQDRLRLAVRDTGPGISADKLDRIFQPFERLGAEYTGVEGAGLGLSLSKRLVEAMGGTIGVESTVGEGTVAWIDLPLQSSPAHPSSASDRSATPGQLTNPPAATLLYIEDNLANSSLVEHILSRRPGTRMLSATEGERGLALAREHRPDAILLDLRLPDIPGEEVLRQLRDDPRTRQIPVAILSADAMPEQIERLRAAGVTTYLAKPFGVPQFLAAVDELLRHKLPQPT